MKSGPSCLSPLKTAASQAQLPFALEDRCEPALPLVGEGAAERGRRQRDEPLQAPAPGAVGGQPPADDEPASRMHDRIERLAGAQPGLHPQRAIEPLGDVLDRDLVAERDVVGEVDRHRLVAALDQDLPPSPEAPLAGAVTVEQDDRKPVHYGRRRHTQAPAERSASSRLECTSMRTALPSLIVQAWQRRWSIGTPLSRPVPRKRRRPPPGRPSPRTPRARCPSARMSRGSRRRRE